MDVRFYFEDRQKYKELCGDFIIWREWFIVFFYSDSNDPFMCSSFIRWMSCKWGEMKKGRKRHVFGGANMTKKERKQNRENKATEEEAQPTVTKMDKTSSHTRILIHTRRKWSMNHKQEYKRTSAHIRNDSLWLLKLWHVLCLVSHIRACQPKKKKKYWKAHVGLVSSGR